MSNLLIRAIQVIIAVIGVVLVANFGATTFKDTTLLGWLGVVLCMLCIFYDGILSLIAWIIKKLK